ncbi:MAG: Ig domain-containing protein [Firmicutes bacterium]|nr:Ig domain-containing protein [Bacillota bacterium]
MKKFIHKSIAVLSTSAVILGGSVLPVFAQNTDADNYDVLYNLATCMPGEVSTLTPHKVDTVNNVAAAEMGFTVTMNAGGPDWATLDPTSQVITCAPGSDVAAKTYLIPLTITYEDGSQENTFAKQMIMTNVEDGAIYTGNEINAYYQSVEVDPEVNTYISPNWINIATNSATSMPEGTTFSKEGSWPSCVNLSSDGIINVNAQKEDAGTEYLLVVDIAFADGSSDAALCSIVVKEAVEPDPVPEKNYEPYYEAIVLLPKDVKSTGIKFKSDVPESASYSLKEGPGWVIVDPGTGEISTKADEKAPGLYTVKVNVHVDEKDVEAICEMNVLDDQGKLKSIEVSPKTLTLKPEETKQLNVTGTPEDALDVSKVTWKSEDEQIATVDGNGVVKAVAPGKVNIVATSENKKTSICQVTVKEPEIQLESIAISPKNVTLKPKETYKLSVSGTPAEALDASKVTWSSQDVKVATVSKDGVVTAVKSGKTVITAKAPNGKTAICEVTVAFPATAIRLDKEFVKIALGSTSSLKVIFSPEGCDEEEVTWSVDNPKIVSVDKNGKFKALQLGKAKITAKTASGLTASCEVKVLKKEDVDTGTQTNSTLYMAGAGIAAIGLIGLFILGRRKK